MAGVANISSEQPFYNGPGPYIDVVPLVTSNLSPADVVACSAVSTAWNDTMKHHTIWWDLFDAKKVPRVHGHNIITAKEDFQYMYPKTVSIRQMAPLGRFFGIVPDVDPDKHETFKTALDAYDPMQKMDKTWKYIVKPAYIFRDYDEELVELLKVNGDFDPNIDTCDKEKGLKIPFTFRNLVVVANYVGAKKGIKVFGDIDSEVLNQCSKVSTGVKVTQMRKEVPESTRNKAPQQKSELAEKYESVDLEARALYDALSILNIDTCPDEKGENRWTYSRTSTKIKMGNNTYSVIIGGFALNTGVHVLRLPYEYTSDNLGAAPVVPAEVLS